MSHAVVIHSVFIAECGYNFWKEGRARREERAYRQVCGQQGRNVTVTMAISPTNGLVFHSAVIGGMNAQRFDDFLAQTRLYLDPDEHVIFIYDGAPAHNNPAILGPNTELTYSPFLNIVEQASNKFLESSHQSSKVSQSGDTVSCHSQVSQSCVSVR